MRTIGNKLRGGLMVLAATLAIVLSVFIGVGNTAHASPSAPITCSYQGNNLEIQTNGPTKLKDSQGTYFADEWVHIDDLVDTLGNICEYRARADVFPVSGHYFGEKMYTELCTAKLSSDGTKNECFEGISGGIISGSATSYTCPNVTYPDHCAIVGPWVHVSYACAGGVTYQMDAEAKPGDNYIDHRSVTSYIQFC